MDGDTTNTGFLFITFRYTVFNKPCKMVTNTGLACFIAKISWHNSVFYSS